MTLDSNFPFAQKMEECLQKEGNDYILKLVLYETRTVVLIVAVRGISRFFNIV